MLAIAGLDGLWVTGWSGSSRRFDVLKVSDGTVCGSGESSGWGFIAVGILGIATALVGATAVGGIEVATEFCVEEKVEALCSKLDQWTGVRGLLV